MKREGQNEANPRINESMSDQRVYPRSYRVIYLHNFVSRAIYSVTFFGLTLTSFKVNLSHLLIGASATRLFTCSNSLNLASYYLYSIGVAPTCHE